MNTIMVWILIGTAWGRTYAQQVGPEYADQASCERVLMSMDRRENFKCVEVKVYK